MAARRPTLRDVARRAGVNPATASRALNPALPGRISAPTEAKVRAAAEELGYRPDPVARSLRTRRSGIVGVIVPDLTNPVLPPIVRAIEGELWEAGIACLLADTDNDVEREAAAISELVARRCEGLIVASATRDSVAVEELAAEGIPTVLVTRDVDSHSLPLVAADDAAGVAAAVAHLAELGHRRLAHVTGPLDLSTTVTRLEALRAACRRHRLELGQRVIHGDAFTTAAGRDAAERLLESDRGFTAIVAGNDLVALGCLQALERAGLECPADVSLLGHNDTPLVTAMRPPLTTVAIPRTEIGVEAARLLKRLLEGEQVEPGPRLLETKLIVRGSAAAPRARE